MSAGRFHDQFGREPDAAEEAPGRVNLIGEHTDYSGGFVLPIAIPQRTRVEAAARTDRTVRVWSAAFEADGVGEFRLGEEQRTGTWLDYVQGMTRELGRAGRLAGFEAAIESSVPEGAGLSSSAALLVATGRMLRALFSLECDDVALALAARRAETELVGAPVGIMDQMASSLGDTRHALFLDTRTLTFESVALPGTAALVVIDSGVAHKHAGGEYVVRRRECADAARLLGVPELRDIDETGLARIDHLPPPLDRRARHVVTENRRVLQTVAALRAGDLAQVGQLFAESHASMRDDFEITVPPIDRLVGLASEIPGIHGARMTGGGFGGAIVALADAGTAESAARTIAAAYAAATSHTPTVIVPVPMKSPDRC